MSPPGSRAGRLTDLARRPLALVAVGVVLYSTGPVLVQASSLSGVQFSFWRLWMGLPLMLALAALQRRITGRRATRRGRRLVLWAGLAFGAHQVAFMSAVKLTTVADVTLMNALAPVVVAVAAIPIFAERPGPAFRAWSLLAMAGAALVAFGAGDATGRHLTGMGLAALNVALFAAFFLISKMAREEIGVLPFLLGVLSVAALSVTVFALAIGEPLAPPNRRDLALAFAVAAGPGAVGHFVMTWPLRWVRANVPPLMRLAQPFIAGLLAWLFLGEAVNVMHLIGGALTIAGACGAILSPAGQRFALEA